MGIQLLVPEYQTGCDVRSESDFHMRFKAIPFDHASQSVEPVSNSAVMGSRGRLPFRKNVEAGGTGQASGLFLKQAPLGPRVFINIHAMVG